MIEQIRGHRPLSAAPGRTSGICERAPFAPLTPAEQQLVDGLESGEEVVIGDGALPGEEAAADRRIRADFIRHLIRGGGSGSFAEGLVPHERGVRIAGAAVEGTLDFHGCTVAHDLSFRNCRFSDAPVFDSAKLESLGLRGSAFPGLRADWLSARNGVSLDGAQANGEVRFVGARIGGPLDCDNLRVSNPGKNALLLMRVEAGGALFLRGTTSIDGAMNLGGARFRSIVDSPECWPKRGDLNLSGCVYGSFYMSTVAAKARLRWLRLQYPTNCPIDFWPQPFEQCALVLRDMGHADEARVILIEKERLQRRSERHRTRAPLKQAKWLRDCLLGGTIRYGHAPMLALVWLLGFWILGTAVSGFAYHQRAFRPHISLLRRPEWVACAVTADHTLSAASLREPLIGRALRGERQLDCFLRQPESESYPPFSSAVYALDTLLPVVSMQMDDYWAPDATKRWGGAAQAYQWFQVVIGWALTFLTVAGFSGLVKSR